MQLSRFWSSLSFCGAGFGLFAAQSVFMGSEKFYHEWLMPVVHILVRDAELTHLLGVKLTSFGIGYRKFPSASDERLIQAKRDKLSRKVFGLDFVHPVGIAAGFDKNGEAILNLLEAGFSHVEVGTVTPKPQDGNPKPRLFRFNTKMALVNR
ncbi:unnamed protein product [Protopolystoma xenopodis]|uniref:Dihydroorotate dehydrogenase catalytic domain-containing protein n=1 Tax=Protopolystoma xenopodis TaxID=117903 RepID=A0A448X0I7_9PLAT|nr:unnamed protein product [Protopolystoma xenopodis]